MKKNDILTLEIIDTGMNGEGIAKAEGYVIFIPYAIKGETVEAKILKAGKDFAFAKTLRVLSPSPDRVEPPCSVFHKCGGCHLMHMSYPAQLEAKRQMVANCLSKAGVAAEVSPVVASGKTLGYRNKLQIPAGRGKIGFFRDNSHDIVDIDICEVVGESSQKLISAIRKYLAESGDTTYDETRHEGNIRHIILRHSGENSDTALIVIVVNGGGLKDEKGLISILRSEFSDFGLYLNFNKNKGNKILGSRYKHIYGREHIEGETAQIKFKVSPDVFMQINDGIAAQIYSDAAKLVEDSSLEAVIDAYSGISILSSIISKTKSQVYAIELNPLSTAAAEELKRQNNIKNLTNINGDTAVELPKIFEKGINAGKTAVILDPPRKGCDRSILDALRASRAAKIIYISCNPATLARDLTHLIPAYKIEKIIPYDMFPQTRHVETLVCLALEQGGEEGACRQ